MKMFFAALLILTTAMTAAAAPEPLEIGGVELPKSMKIGAKTLLLNGAGLRTKTILAIKIYAGGLYLEKKNSDPDDIISADRPMAIKMNFIYNGVSAKKIVNTWNEGFEKYSPRLSGSLQEKVNKFNSFFTEEVNRGDTFDIIYLPGKGVAVHVKGELKGVVEGLEFKKALFSIWLGSDPCDKGLKAGMLGEEED